MKYRQKVEGVVKDGDGRILIVKAPASQFWMLPGGGIKSEENKCSAAKRELQEECGVNICNVKFFRELERINDYSLLTEGFSKTFNKGAFLGAQVYPFCAHVLKINLSNLEEGTKYKSVTYEKAITIFQEQSIAQKEVLFQWIEICRIQHIRVAFK